MSALSSRFTTLQHYFPVRGHSFLDNDRDFHIVKAYLKPYDRVYNLRTYWKLIANASPSPTRFQVHRITREHILRFKSFWQRTYFKKVISEETRVCAAPRRRGQNWKAGGAGRPGSSSAEVGASSPPVYFEISKYSDFLYSGDSIVARYSIDGPVKHTFNLQKKNAKIVLPTRCVKKRKPLEPVLKAALTKLFAYIPQTPENLRYWTNKL